MPKEVMRARGATKVMKQWDIDSDGDSSDSDWEPDTPNHTTDSDWEDIDVSFIEKSNRLGVRVIYDPEEDEPDMSDLSESDIRLVDLLVEECKVSRPKAVEAIRNNRTELVSALSSILSPVNEMKIIMTLPTMLGDSLKSIRANSGDDDESVQSMTKEKVKLLKKLPDELEYSEEEFDYLAGLPREQQRAIIKQELEIIERRKHKNPLRFRVLESDMSMKMKSVIIERIEQFNRLEPGDSEYAKLAAWINTITRVPFSRYVRSPISADDSVETITASMKSIRAGLDEVVYGHNTAKERILELIAANIRNPDGRGYCLGIQGPAGNGKTTLIKHGVCKKLGRPFSMISLGGATDADYLAGHGYTYEGSRPGRMVEALVEAGCMNPVIFFDELDKVSQTAKGEEIFGYLCHLVDYTQNDQIHDKFFAGVDFDFSKAIFVFSFNDESLINPILRDRIHIIRTDGFRDDDKVRIARDYLLPDVLRDFKLPEGCLRLSDDVFKRMIQKYTNGEDGVRSLRRCIHSLVSKYNVNLLTGKLGVGNSLEVTEALLDEYLSLLDIKTNKVPDMYL